ncbi:hypothetical protein BT96DRAFT_33257 [Gymnopus androsaceus JB14]|uniref:Uncharacterized protein n=1 Tax=Gymnopus androsaceus JB14 TaxID=1447944 RepID=A0A6A4HM79_9AGAR|nr:hypothetical protein BT96DRAFT_33257 [Gymnopus androsaceus JB14]
MQRMLEQRQTNILKVAQERNWFVPSDHLLQHPIGWSSYLWEEWVAGWELVPIVSRSHTELVLEHYFGMAGKFTPIMFQLDPFAPDFVFRYEGRDVSEVQGGAASMEQGSPGAYYYFRMGDDEIFKFSSEYDVYSPEEFVRAAGTTPDSDIPGFDLDSMMRELSVVPALPDSERSTRAFAKDCDRELIQFEERLAALGERRERATR